MNLEILSKIGAHSSIIYRTVISDYVAMMKRARITELYPGEKLRIFFFRLSVWLRSPMTLVSPRQTTI